jgi:branched-chain amino acid transport system permease protein
MVKNHFLIWILAILALVLFPLIIPGEFITFLLTEILIMGLFAMSFNLLLGYTGLLSFGHAAFFGLGAYTLTLLITKASLPILPSFLLSLFIPLLFALVIGYFCIQRIKVYFALLSLAFGQIIYTIIFKWYDFTGGDTGIYGIPRPAPFGWGLNSTVAYYYFTLPFILLSLVSLFVIVRSPFGMILRAIRENPERAEYLAVHVKKYQLLSFIISSFFAAEAGILFVFFQGYTVPIFAHANKTVEALVMTILGGTYSFIGPMIGAAILTGLDKILTTYTEYWALVLGVILLFLSLYLPGGMMGLAEKIKASLESQKKRERE